jgi:nucleotide-binding universal stress UspA family protein
VVRSILVGLDGSRYAEAATEVGVRWAAEFGGLLVGLAVVDEPTITAPEATPMGAAYYTGERDEERVAEARRTAAGWLGGFADRAARAGVAATTARDEGDPVERFRERAERYDLVVVGQRTHYRYMTQEGPCDTLDRLLHDTARPVVAVPERLPGGEAVVVAYDGSPQAARAVYAYQASGLGARYPTVVVTVGDDPAPAERAAEFLGRHSGAVTVRVVRPAGRPGEALLDQVAVLRAQLLVMGAFGHSPAYEFFFGSTTRRVLTGMPVPVFMVH